MTATTVRPDKTVLVVEDDPWIRSLMADLLAGEGYSVVQASDGKAGLEMAEDNEPDVILLDLAMPEKSGLDVLHELKSSKPTRDIPVIVVSAYAMLMMGSDARRADGVIQKPFDLADLLLQVEPAAAKRRQPARYLHPEPRVILRRNDDGSAAPKERAKRCEWRILTGSQDDRRTS